MCKNNGFYEKGNLINIVCVISYMRGFKNSHKFTKYLLCGTIDYKYQYLVLVFIINGGTNVTWEI